MSDKEILHIGSLDQIYKEFDLITPQKAKRIIEIFENNKSEILIPGGFVRDVLLKKIPHDIDFATNLNPDEIENLLTKELNSEYKKLELQGKTFGVIRIIMNNNDVYEIATFRKDGSYNDGVHPSSVELIDDAKEDALRRDFTINALFYDPLSGDIIDYVGGLKDIKEKKLRFVGDANLRINEDKSRILRYMRFLILTDFYTLSDDIETIKNHAKEIQDIPKELLKKELDKIIDIANPKIFIETLEKLNLLENIFPEIKSLEKCEQSSPYHLEGNVLNHTKLVCKNLPENSSSTLKWSAMFHDIGKPETRKVVTKNEQKTASFIGHNKVSSTKTKTILKNLKFSNKEILEIVFLVENHMQMFEILKLVNNNKEKELTIFIKKLILKNSIKRISNLITLGIADYLGSISNSPENKQLNKEKILACFDLAKKEIQNDIRLGIDVSKIIDGKIIMEKLSITPGKKLGILKNQITNELSDQKFASLEEAKNTFLNILDKYKN